jgi:mono/diheme cytochrome c family protein
VKVHSTIDCVMNKRYLYIIGVFAILSGLQGCYYDIEEELYPSNGGNCDTAAVTYSGTIQTILNESCNSCHSAASAQGNVVLEGYNLLKVYVDDGSFLGAVSHGSGYSPMPKGGNKLSDCKISQIQTWIAAGAPNN